jgi:RNA polymerase sigma-70 factor, ECF subfamily
MSKPEQPSDFSLAALKAGDRAEFARLVETYSPPIYRLALRITGDPQNAEDVLQETFIKAFRNLGDFEGRSNISTWLFRIAYNESLMLIRRRHPENVSIDQDFKTEEGDLEPIQIVDWHDLPEEELVSGETRTVLGKAIQDLPHIFRAVFLLRDVQDLSVKETAEVLGLSEAAVKTRLLRARLHLREQLSTYFKERMSETS